MTVTDEQFCHIWQNAKSIAEVREKSGYIDPTAKAARLRRKGYSLKKFSQGSFKGISDKQFVAAWNNAATLSEAAYSIGYTVEGAKVRASKLRAKGIALKRYSGTDLRNWMLGHLRNKEMIEIKTTDWGWEAVSSGGESFPVGKKS